VTTRLLLGLAGWLRWSDGWLVGWRYFVHLGFVDVILEINLKLFKK